MIKKSGRRCVRFAFQDRAEAKRHHEGMHGRLVEAGCLVEYNSPGYGAVDCDSEQAAEKALAELNPLLEVGLLIWEWADQAS